MSSGWIKLSRKMLDWGWYLDTNTKVVFLHLLLKATHKPIEYKGIKLKPGEVVTTRKDLAEELLMSDRMIRTALLHLKTTNEVSIKTTNRFSIITIEKWAFYQCKEQDSDQPSDQPSDQQETNKRPTRDQPIEQESKEYKNNNIYNIAHFSKPTVEQIAAYCKERGNCVDAQVFFDFYESKGWMVGRNKMKNWQAAVRTWERQGTAENVRHPTRTQRGFCETPVTDDLDDLF